MIQFKSRKYTRVDSLNLVHYNTLDKDNNVTTQGMGRTLNVSQGGILIETHVSIDAKYVMLIAIGFKDDLIDLKGKVVYCKSGEDNKFEVGIEFLTINDTECRILNKYISAFREQILED